MEGFSRKAVSRIPQELWQEIFEFAASVHRKFELTLEGAAYVMANDASRKETGIPTPEEEAELRRLRSTIVQVCRVWDGIGIRALWSHLYIDLEGNPKRAIKGVQK